MYYFTVKQSPVYEQMTLEDFLFGENPQIRMINPGLTNTRTYKVTSISTRLRSTIDVEKMICRLSMFNHQYDDLFKADRKSLYYTFYIPKKSGGYRKIDAPNDRLMAALRELKTIFSDEFGALYHTAAHAYIEHRDNITCMKVHQKNESKWFQKMDMKNFFNSTTEKFIMDQFAMIFPFCEIIAIPTGKSELRKALSLAFLDGCLPQGTPISPMLTNIMMIPIDHHLAGIFREYNHQRFIYTRYADDIQISSKYEFSKDEIESIVRSTLVMFHAPFMPNNEKTRYGSANGHNFNLGLMLNKDNNITVGHKKKRELRAGLDAYVKDRKNGIQWELGDVQVLNGQMTYCIHVEGVAVTEMIQHLCRKYSVDIPRMIREDLRKDPILQKAVYVEVDESDPKSKDLWS